MMIKLPKVNKLGQYKETAISADQIKGIEPSSVSCNGKTYKGCKVYTTGGTYFKVVVDPMELMLLHAHVLKTGLPAAASNLLTGEKATMLQPVGQSLPKQDKLEVKQLPAPKKELKKFW